MNMKNEILSEVWRNRDEFARRYHYDLDEMVAALQEMERHPVNTVVDRTGEMAKNDTPCPDNTRR